MYDVNKGNHLTISTFIFQPPVEASQANSESVYYRTV
jgi:hypothetical protein